MRAHRVRALLMGGQACVLYGAAEFSRDTDFALLAEAANLIRLRRALADLRAEPIAVPPFEVKYLRKGHAIHFRCQHPEALRMRIHVMSYMRGVKPFDTLWRQRSVVELADGIICDILSLPDLVQAKKTQHDKDWPMIRRLLEAHYFQHQKKPTLKQFKFWFQELRTPSLLVELARKHSDLCRQFISKRPLLRFAAVGSSAELERALLTEESTERELDKAYWDPLRRELEQLRHYRG